MFHRVNNLVNDRESLRVSNAFKHLVLHRNGIIFQFGKMFNN